MENQQETTETQAMDSQQPLQAAQESVQTQSEDWRSSLPEDLKEAHKELKTPADVLKSYSELSGKLGNAIIPPGEDATEEQIQKFQERVAKLNGRPEDPSGYEIKMPEEISEYIVPERMDKFKEIAHKHGLSPRAMEDFASAYASQYMEDLQSAPTVETAQEEMRKALAEELGGSDKAEKVEYTAREALKRLGYQDDVVEVLMTMPDFVKQTNEFAPKLSEGSLSLGNRSGVTRSAGDIYSELQETIRQQSQSTSLNERESLSRKASELSKAYTEALKAGS